MPFIGGVADHLSGQSERTQQMVTGSSVIVQQKDQIVGQIIDPTGRALLSLADSGSRSSVVLEETGIYEVQTDRSSYLIAANIDSRESQIESISIDQVERWAGLPTLRSPISAEQSALVENADNTDIRIQTTDLWPVLLILFAITLLLESLFANNHLNIRREA